MPYGANSTKYILASGMALYVIILGSNLVSISALQLYFAKRIASSNEMP